MLRGETRPELVKIDVSWGIYRGDVCVFDIPGGFFDGLVVHAMLDVLHLVVPLQ